MVTVGKVQATEQKLGLGAVIDELLLLLRRQQPDDGGKVIFLVEVEQHLTELRVCNDYLPLIIIAGMSMRWPCRQQQG